MDIVYVNRAGDNPELRYSLRSLANVRHDDVWVFGGAPHWLNEETVRFVERAQEPSAYASTRRHVLAACRNEYVSDPFMLWNDDFYAMEPTVVRAMHRGRLRSIIREYARIRANTPWTRGVKDALHLLEGLGLEDLGFEDPVSYELHVPLVVYKETMRQAVARVEDSGLFDFSHMRTVYGNMASLGGLQAPDCKLLRRTDPFPEGAWLSSGANTFRSAVEPVLRYLFPNPSIYEKD